jgi:hypothetical protein
MMRNLLAAAALALSPLTAGTATAGPPPCEPGQVMIYDAWHPFGDCVSPRGQTSHGGEGPPESAQPGAPNNPPQPAVPNRPEGTP